MGLEIRPLEEHELDVATDVFFAAMLMASPAEALRPMHRARHEAGRTLGALVDGRLVGSAASRPLDVVVPGGSAVTSAGVTRVGVLPAHTRRGIASSLLRAQLADVAGRGEAFATLRATEAVIYGRFGYGVASQFARYEVERSRAAFRAPVAVGGTFRVLDRSEVPAVLPALHRRCAQRPGGILRPDWMWPLWLRGLADDPPPARWVVVHLDDDGEADGYADYSVPRPSPLEMWNVRVEVDELWAVDDEVAAALARWILDLDLVGTVVLDGRPLDEPLRWRLADSRRLVTHEVRDETWLRVTDVGAALSARAYAPVEGVVVDVADDLLAGQAGAWEVDPDGARRTDREPDLGADVAVLGATYLGGTSWAELAAAGRVEERTAGAVARADRLFAVRPLPWSGTFF